MPKKYLLSSFFNNLRRKKNFKKKSKHKKTRILDTKFATYAKNLLLVLIVVFIVYTFVLPVGKTIISFELSNYPYDSVSGNKWVRNQRMNLLFIGVDDLQQDNIFVDGLLLMIIDPKSDQIGIFNISPDLSSYSPAAGENIYIRTAFNSGDDSDGLTRTIEAVENLLAIRVDKYILTDKDSFTQATQSYQASRVSLDQDIHDADLSNLDSNVLGWSSGVQSIYPQEFIPFLAADELGENEQLSRQLQFMKSQISNINTPNTYIHISDLLIEFSDNIYTNLDEYELLRLLWELRNLRDDQVKLAYTRQESMIESDAFGIYSRYSPIVESIDDDLSSILLNTSILKEQAKIEVLNGSSVTGLAYNRARWITNLGGRVILYSNSPVKEDITKVYVEEPEKFPSTLDGIERVFNGKIEYPQQGYKYKHVGDIVIVIGEDYE